VALPYQHGRQQFAVLEHAAGFVPHERRADQRAARDQQRPGHRFHRQVRQHGARYRPDREVELATQVPRLRWVRHGTSSSGDFGRTPQLAPTAADLRVKTADDPGVSL
jgi:hypothetical protein